MRSPMLMITAALGLIGTIVTTASAQHITQSVYYRDFETPGYMPEWSNNQIFTTETNFTRFLGRFDTHTPSLTWNLPELPPPTSGEAGAGVGTSFTYMVTFDFYCIDSWDGYGTIYGPDTFHVLVNGVPVFSETFANQHSTQSYTGPAKVLRQPLGFDSRYTDSIYRIEIPFTAPAGTTRFSWYQSNSQGMSDESWGIDNVNVGFAPIPSIPGPASASLVALAAYAGVWRRRR
ncbi:MAG: hypothetical protein KF745_13495 [Phycisphaeraceae bacterium]|nr:hypothetical protein [Phycisphaeraceae bacterium]